MILWEHLVLEHLQAHLPEQTLQYWRDTDGREIDFVVVRNRDQVDIMECKWNPDHFSADAMKIFRSFYPNGRNFLVCPISMPAHQKKISGLDVTICNPGGFIERSGSELIAP